MKGQGYGSLVELFNDRKEYLRKVVTTCQEKHEIIMKNKSIMGVLSRHRTYGMTRGEVHVGEKEILDPNSQQAKSIRVHDARAVLHMNSEDMIQSLEEISMVDPTKGLKSW